jgi:hypothetical protein
VVGVVKIGRDGEEVDDKKRGNRAQSVREGIEGREKKRGKGIGHLSTVRRRCYANNSDFLRWLV